MSTVLNPPAFPIPEYREFSRPEWKEGMHLRDYFAGQLLAGFSAQYGLAGDNGPAISKRCYDVANCMLAERANDPANELKEAVKELLTYITDTSLLDPDDPFRVAIVRVKQALM